MTSQRLLTYKKRNKMPMKSLAYAYVATFHSLEVKQDAYEKF